jgi:hypothetical protein
VQPGTADSFISLRKNLDPIAGELEASTDDHTSVKFQPGARPVTTQGTKREPLDRSAGTCQLHPVEHAAKGQVALMGGVNRPTHRARRGHQRLHPGQAGPCRSPTHLCQVGTTPSHRTVEIKLPQTEVPAEIQNRDLEAAIRRDQATPGTKNEPASSVSREQVDYALKPVRTTTSDQQIRQTADPEGGPRPQIDSLVNLRFSTIPKVPKVGFEARRIVQHGFLSILLEFGTSFAY